jgi:hypothetical protein
MSGRRSHPRFGVNDPWEGAIRVLRDVVVDRTGADELLAVSHAPGVIDEVLSLDLLGGGSSLALRVKVLDSRPVIVNGAMKHRLRLGMLATLIGARHQEEAAPKSMASGAGLRPAEAV